MFGRAQASRVSVVESEVNAVLAERLCACGQGTPFYVLSCFLFYFQNAGDVEPRPALPPTLQVLHIWRVCQERETICLPSNPHVCAF